jgi:hypothetical protein
MYDTVTIAQCGLVSQPGDPGARPCYVYLIADWVGKVIRTYGALGRAAS